MSRKGDLIYAPTVDHVPCRSIGEIAGLRLGGERRGVELVIDVVLLAVFLGGKHGAAMLVDFANDSYFDVLWIHGLRVPIGFIASECDLKRQFAPLDALDEKIVDGIAKGDPPARA